MKLAITVWNGRIAPLFDVARMMVVARTEAYGRPIQVVSSFEMEQALPALKAATLRAMEVDAVVCGAISREYEEALLDAGMELDAFVAGDMAEVLHAWSLGTLRVQGFSMPGCHCPHHRCMRHGHHRHERGPHGPR